MPVVKSDIPQLLLSGLKGVFFDAYESTIGDWEKIATIIPSEHDTEQYAWLGSTPRMREFTDERLPAGLLEHDYSIKNKTWEASISVDRAALEDDQYGQIRIRTQQLGAEARWHQDQIVFEMLDRGFGTADTCHDGQYFFDSDHSEGASGTQSNKGTSALDSTTLQAAITAMSKFVDDKGKPLGVIPDTLVVPPDLKWTAMELLKSGYNVDGTANNPGKINVLQGALDLVVSPYLTNTTNWFVFCTKRIVKPIIFQSRIPVDFQALEANSETGFMRDMYVYGVRARYNVGFGLWQFAYGAHVT